MACVPTLAHLVDGRLLWAVTSRIDRLLPLLDISGFLYSFLEVCLGALTNFWQLHDILLHLTAARQVATSFDLRFPELLSFLRVLLQSLWWLYGSADELVL